MLDLYLKKSDRSKFYCNLWAVDDFMHMLKSLCMGQKLDLLQCQLTIKVLDVAPAKTIIFFLP